MGGLLLRLRSWWDGADTTQRTVALVGGGFLSLLVVVTYLFATKPHMGLLASGLSGAEQGSIVQELQKKGVPYELDMNGGISVPAERIPEIRANLMFSGHNLGTSRGGADPDIAKLSMMTTPSVEKEQLKAIAENKLSESISSLDGVASATVHLALGNDSPFVADHKASSASVTVFEKPGSVITKEQARGISMIVAGSVPELDPNSVSVLNGHGEMLVDPTEQGSGNGKVAAKLATERLEAKRREREIQSKLDTVFGPGNTNATVDLEIDFKGEKYDQIQHTPSGTQTVAETTEKMNGGASAGSSAVAAGVNANAAPSNPTAVPGVTPPSQGYENKVKQLETQWDTKTTQGDDPAGKIKSMNISVLVNDKVKDADIQAWLDSYLGARKADAAFSAKVVKTAFDTSSAKTATDAAAQAASRDRMQQIMSLLPLVALVGVALLVLKAIGKFAKTQTLVVATPDGRMIPLPSSGLNLTPEAIAASGGDIQLAARTAQAAAMTSGRAQSTPSAPRLPRQTEVEDDPEIDAIKRKINVPLEQIKKMSNDRPEVVAMLIKSWLMEERR